MQIYLPMLSLPFPQQPAFLRPTRNRTEIITSWSIEGFAVALPGN
jgi:hypothetical protein